VKVGVRMTTVDESLTPSAGSQLAFAHRRAFEVERGQEAQPGGAIRLEQEGRLHDAELGKAFAAGHRVGASERGDGVSCQMYLGWPLGPERAAPQGEPKKDSGARQSDGATADRPAERPARRKSRFIRVMVSMLISLGQASWHSPWSVQ
jgi:hypothetical protein